MTLDRRATALLLLLRVFMGMVFVAAAVEKVADPAAFAHSIDNYRLLPSGLLLLSATWLSWLELLCGLALVFGMRLRGASFLTSVLLLIFTLAVISGVMRGLDISCGCFTQDPGVAKIGWLKVLENTGLLLLSVWVYFHSLRSERNGGKNDAAKDTAA